MIEDGFSSEAITKHFIEITIKAFQEEKSEIGRRLRTSRKSFKTYKNLLQMLFSINSPNGSDKNYKINQNLCLILKAFDIHSNQYKRNRKEDSKKYSYPNYEF